MKRRTPLTRHTRLRPVNPERRSREHERTYGEHAHRVRAHGCYVAAVTGSRAGCWGASEACHTAGGGAGRKADASTLADLCHGHHAEYDLGHARFEAKYGVDMTARAAELSRAYQETP